MDIVREILCKISDAPGKPDQDLLVKDKTSEEAERVLYHVELLVEAGLLKGQQPPLRRLGTPMWTDLDLTWAGHDSVDAIRDPQIWNETRKGLEAAGDQRGEAAFGGQRRLCAIRAVNAIGGDSAISRNLDSAMA